MRLLHLWLTDFRCYESLDLEIPAGCTVIVGANGHGKTSLLEAVGWLSTARSFRGVPDASLVRAGAPHAIVRAVVENADREQLVEVELHGTGRNRVLVNRRSLARRRDLVDVLRVTVFSPDDLELVKGGPAGRRAYLDDLLTASAPRYDAARSDFERVLRQRNALLRGGARDEDARHTLDVFDEQLLRSGAELVRGRLRLAARVMPVIELAYRALAPDAPDAAGAYEAEWAEGPIGLEHVDEVEDRLRVALAARRRQELERGTSLVGPHRDEWRLRLNGLDTRTHASQGEQRTLALGLRLAAHRVVAELVGETPVLLLDDVFSELDPHRADALVAALPPGQTLLTTAGAVPVGVHPERRLRVVAGRLADDAAAGSPASDPATPRQR